MEEIEEEMIVVRVDKQGRLVLPSWIRKSLGLKEGGDVALRLSSGGRKILIESKQDEDLKKKSKIWFERTLNTRAEAFSDEPEDEAKKDDSWKWMSREYARRKLGLR